jgi:hypothetical protein
VITDEGAVVVDAVALAEVPAEASAIDAASPTAAADAAAEETKA